MGGWGCDCTALDRSYPSNLAAGFLDHLQTKILTVAAKEVKEWLEGDLYRALEHCNKPVVVVGAPSWGGHLCAAQLTPQCPLEYYVFCSAAGAPGG